MDDTFAKYHTSISMMRQKVADAKEKISARKTTKLVALKDKSLQKNKTKNQEKF